MSTFFTNINSQLFFKNINKKSITHTNKTYSYLIKDFTFPTINNIISKDLEITDSLIDNFLKTIKSKKNSTFPIQYDLIDFEFEFFKFYHKIKFNNEFNNINKEEFLSIKNFIKFKPFIITECDKNIGWCILSHQTYDELIFEHLNNTEFFLKLDICPLNETTKLITDNLTYLKDEKLISKKIFDKCLIDNPKLGKFRILSKVHKTKFGTRPLVNCNSHPTSNIAQIIYYLLEPFVKETSSYIQDSQHLLNILSDLTPQKNLELYTFDIVNLYLNLIQEHVLNLLTDFMKDKINTKHLTIRAFNTLLKLILYNNIIVYKNNYFCQSKGIAMGCICAPVIANLYLSILEKSFLITYNPFLYKRYIDDIFLIILKNVDAQLLSQHFHNLELTLSSKTKVNFLDLDIYIDNFSNNFITSLYIKPTQTFSFVLPISNHPNFICKNIPLSIFIRIRRNCTFLHDYFYFSNIYFLNFLQRGYCFDNLCKISNTVARMDRTKLLVYKQKDTFSNKNVIISSIPFDKNFDQLDSLLKDCFNNIKVKNQALCNLDLKITHSMQPNLNCILNHNIPSFNFKFYKNSKYENCKDENCNICKYSSNSNFIHIKDDIKLPIICSSSCNSTNVIYIIHCKKCNSFYIGQTKRSIKNRIKEHLYAIKKFIPYFSHHLSVPIHFNLKNHSIKDLNFFIYLKDAFSVSYLDHYEAKLIYIFKDIFKVKLMNNRFPSAYNNIYDIKI